MAELGATTLSTDTKLPNRTRRLVAHIEDVVLSPDVQGKGFGKRVIKALLAVAKQRGAYKVILDAAEENAAFYEKVR